MAMGHTHAFCAEGGDGGLVLRFAGTPLHRYFNCAIRMQSRAIHPDRHQIQ
jgi:hypothetical protein